MSEESATIEGDWDTDFQKPEEKSDNTNNERKGLPWMKFDKPGEYRVRLVGKFVKFHRWWSPFTTRIITHISFKDKDKAWLAGHWPRKTFAIHVIDRSDTSGGETGTLKILEKGNSVFEAFSNYNRINNINPSTKQGPDFVIEVEWPNGNKRQAKYKVTACAVASPWTQEEMEMIKEGHADLKKIYAPTPLEDINAAWDALPEDAKVPPKRDGQKSVPSEKVQQPAPVPVETVSVSDEDDLFGDNDDSTGF
jgi:hypothetical protein